PAVRAVARMAAVARREHVARVLLIEVDAAAEQTLAELYRLVRGYRWGGVGSRRLEHGRRAWFRPRRHLRRQALHHRTYENQHGDRKCDGERSLRHHILRARAFTHPSTELDREATFWPLCECANLRGFHAPRRSQVSFV